MQLQGSESTTSFTPEVRSVLLALKDPVVAGDENEQILFLNHAAERLLGFSTQELAGNPLTSIMPPRFRAAHALGFSKAAHGHRGALGAPLRVKALHRHGTEFNVELTLSELRTYNGKVGVVVILRDLRERSDLFSHEVTFLMRSRERLAEAEERLRLAVEAANVGTWDYDPRTGKVRCDARYKELFGVPAGIEVTREMLVEAIHPDDRERAIAAVDRAFEPQSGGSYAIEYRTRGISDGRERWVAMRGRSLFDEAGQAARLVGTGVDITSERAARESLQLLADASRVLASSLDYRTTLTQIARILVPRLADWCVIEVLNEQGSIEEVAITHSDPTKEALARELRRRYRPEDHASSSMTQVIQTREPKLVREVTDEVLVSAARDEEHLRILREVGLCSSILVPLSLGDRAIGTLGLYQAESGRHYGDDDVIVAEELGRRAALAIENARLFEAAKAAIRMRDDFLSIASHELKTPVTSLRLYLDALARDMGRCDAEAVPTAKMLMRVSKANRQVERLTILISELLDVSRIDCGKLTLVRTPMDLTQLVCEVVDSFHEQARAFGTVLQVNAPEPVLGTWDKDRLEQVVTNLITNALKHAPGHPTQLEVTRREERAILSVIDQGPGIATVDQGRIFERFERGSQTKNIGGFGLGLWIVREIVTAHGGYVRVESMPSEGSTFVVELPIQ